MFKLLEKTIGNSRLYKPLRSIYPDKILIGELRFREVEIFNTSLVMQQIRNLVKTSQILRDLHESHDLALEKIAKRLLIEFNHKDRIIIPAKLNFLLKNLYFPKHISVEIVKQERDNSYCDWPTAQNINIRVVDAQYISEKGEIVKNFDDQEPPQNLEKQTKVIAIMKMENFKIFKETNSKLISGSLDILITDMCVFRLNHQKEKLEMTEYSGDYDRLQKIFKEWKFQPLTSDNLLKNIKQQCI